MRISLLISLLLSLFCLTEARAQGSIFGGLQLDQDFFIRDEKVNAQNTPHYDNLKSGTNAWLNVDYTNDQFDFDAGIRMDFFFNSNLHNPGTPYSAQGLGLFYVRKRFKDLQITGGHFYDQIGSGIIFRAYEDRTLGIDNALLGIHLRYNILDKGVVKAFGGVQKNRLQLYKPIIKGVALEGNFSLGEKVQFIPGLGAVNRTLDQESMDFIVAAIETYDTTNRFVPKYNTYAVTGYYTLNFGKFSWYAEGAYKSHEAIPDANGVLIDRPGHVVFTNLTFATTGLGITGQFKRTQNFVMRTSPNEFLLNGMVAFIPPVTRQNSLRLPARYNAATQELEEMAYSLDITYTPKRGLTFNVNGSEVRDFENQLLWREIYFDAEYRINKKWRVEGGLSYINYNQLFYEGEIYTQDERNVQAITPFAEVIYKINRKHSLRMQFQTMLTDEDFGGWVYGLVEYSIAPWFSLAVTDMYNYKPNEGRVSDDLHYYSVLAAFTYMSHRLTVAYVRQVEGVVCTGGICRFEPAFNGARLSFNTTF